MPRALRSWRTKAMLQHVFSRVPWGSDLNYIFQRYVTRSSPASDSRLERYREIAAHHVRNVEANLDRPLGDARFFEFGAGWDLCVPILLHRLGVRHQRVIDLRPLLRQDLVVDMVRRVQPDLEAERPLGELLESLGVDYIAPADARATELPDGSIDAITSTNTLEHIPPCDIAAILRECRRILQDDGVMSFEIDYRDHYAYFDDRLPTLHYLAYDERSWRRWNPALHHQNRLRHDDYLRLFDEAGFEVIDQYVEPGSDADKEFVGGLAVAWPLGVERAAIQGSRLAVVKRP